MTPRKPPMTVDSSGSGKRIDVLIYCHDGRGLGHLSRSIAIALAMHRLSPSARVVLITGSEYVPALAGYGRVEWIKLPSYITHASDGSAVTGADGATLRATITLRRRLIRETVAELKPHSILV